MTGMHWKKRVFRWLGIGFCTLLAAASAPAQISLSSAVALALQNSTQVRAAIADVQHAAAGLSETRDAYLPNFVLGSSVGYTYGFPVGQPSVFSAASNSLLYSFSQPDYVRASRAALQSAELNLKDNRQQVMLDCALAYVQLDTDIRELAVLDDQKAAAEKLVRIERDRMNAGVDSRMDETKAEITSTQVDINRYQVQDDAIEQRQKLSHLTGLPAASFIPDTKSIPPFPDFSTNDLLVDQAVASNAGIQSAYANAQSKLELAYGDSRQNFRPQFGFGLEYNRYAEFNNYSEYYLRFQHNNFDVGVEITIPIFDAKSRAKARESAADAARANAEADQAKNQTSEQVVSLRHRLDELRTQQHYAELQSQLAQEQFEAVQSELKNGTGSPNLAPVTPKDEALANIAMQQRYQDAFNAGLTVVRTQLNLLRSIGAIEAWVNSSVK